MCPVYLVHTLWEYIAKLLAAAQECMKAYASKEWPSAGAPVAMLSKTKMRLVSGNCILMLVMYFA
jgi:hypothetical protein